MALSSCWPRVVATVVTSIVEAFGKGESMSRHFARWAGARLTGNEGKKAWKVEATKETNLAERNGCGKEVDGEGSGWGRKWMGKEVDRERKRTRRNSMREQSIQTKGMNAKKRSSG